MLKKAVSVFVSGVFLMLCLSGCAAQKYSVDYNGRKSDFTGAKDCYRAGAAVTLYYSLIATDTDYTFRLEGAELEQDYSEEKGFILRFTMPAHNVKLIVESRNSMEYVPQSDLPQTQTQEAQSSTAVSPEKQTEAARKAVLVFDSFDGGGPSYAVEIADPTVLKCSMKKEYKSPFHNQMKGAGFRVTFTFTGLKPGETAFTVAVRSPITGNEELYYTASVDDALRVTLNAQTRR